MKPLVTSVLGLWLTMAAIAVPSVADAQDGPRPTKVTSRKAAQGKVRVDALVVHATNGSEVDPRLRILKRKLAHLRYTGFTVLDSHTSTISPGQTATVSIVGGRRLRIGFLNRDDKQARVRIQLFKDNEKKLDTTVQMPRDKSFIVAGPSHKGGKLVFPITISY